LWQNEAQRDMPFASLPEVAEDLPLTLLVLGLLGFFSGIPDAGAIFVDAGAS
jgi:hypothetical protein